MIVNEHALPQQACVSIAASVLREIRAHCVAPLCDAYTLADPARNVPTAADTTSGTNEFSGHHHTVTALRSVGACGARACASARCVNVV